MHALQKIMHTHDPHALPINSIIIDNSIKFKWKSYFTVTQFDNIIYLTALQIKHSTCSIIHTTVKVYSNTTVLASHDHSTPGANPEINFTRWVADSTK